jgi:hypothetical protein
MKDLAERQGEELKQLEKGQKHQIDLIVAENDKILSAALQE